MFTVGDRVRPNVLINCDHGMFIVNRFDYVVSQSGEKVGQGQWLLDHGNASTVEANMTLSLIKDLESPVIFDVGANIGTYSSWIAKLLPNSKIYAFEPQRLVFQMFCGNMSVNNFENVYAYNQAVSDVAGQLTFTEPDYTSNNNFGSFSLVEDLTPAKSKYSSTVDVITIDQFVEKYQIPRVDFIKIDVEGMDLLVLGGAKKTIQSYQPGILVEYSNDQNNYKDQIIEKLSELGSYEFYVEGNNLLARKSHPK